MSREIEVTFPIGRFREVGNEVACMVELLAAMRKAGIPAKGRVTLQGVEYGTLTMHTDSVFGDLVYRWSSVGPDGEDEDPAADL